MRAALLAFMLLGCSATPHEPMPTQPPRPRIVAHRGASAEAPENTLAAFRRAWALGVEACELDVRVTADGEVVVFHDSTTLRIGGVDRPISEQTLAELRSLDVGAWKHVKYQRERIPTLAEALATIPAGRTMFVEIKTSAPTAGAIASVIQRARPTNVAIALQGFDPDALGALAAALPDAPAFWTVDPPHDDHDRLLPYPVDLVADARQRGFAGLALDFRGVTPELLAAASKAELLVDVWTVNYTSLLADWAGRDVRWIETDHPELVP